LIQSSQSGVRDDVVLETTPDAGAHREGAGSGSDTTAEAGADHGTSAPAAGAASARPAAVAEPGRVAAVRPRPVRASTVAALGTASGRKAVLLAGKGRRRHRLVHRRRGRVHVLLLRSALLLLLLLGVRRTAGRGAVDLRAGRGGRRDRVRRQLLRRVRSCEIGGRIKIVNG
jgi:hypothetical protein